MLVMRQSILPLRLALYSKRFLAQDCVRSIRIGSWSWQKNVGMEVKETKAHHIDAMRQSVEHILKSQKKKHLWSKERQSCKLQNYFCRSSWLMPRTWPSLRRSRRPKSSKKLQRKRKRLRWQRELLELALLQIVKSTQTSQRVQPDGVVAKDVDPFSARSTSIYMQDMSRSAWMKSIVFSLLFIWVISVDSICVAREDHGEIIQWYLSLCVQNVTSGKQLKTLSERVVESPTPKTKKDLLKL